MIIRDLLISFGAKLDKGSMDKVDRQVDQRTAGISKRVSTGLSAAGAAAFIGGVAKGFFVMARMASGVEENLNVINESLGENQQKVREWARTFGDEVGRSRFEMEGMAGGFGALLDPMMEGNSKVVTDMSTKLSQLAVDLDSYYNASERGIDTARALTAAITGEAEPMKRLGVIMNETTLQEFANAQGIRTKVKDMKNAEKTMLRYNFILDQTQSAQGDAARTADGFANSFRSLASKGRELLTVLGIQLLPMFTWLSNKVRDFISYATKLVEITNLGKAALIALGAAAIAMAPAVLAFFAPMLIPILKVAAVIAILTLIIDDFLTFLDGGDSLIGRFIDSMFGPGSATEAATNFKLALKYLKEIWVDHLLPGIKDFIRAMGEVLEAMTPVTDAILKGLGEAIIWAQEKFEAFIKWLVEDAANDFEAFYNKIAGFFKSIGEWWDGLAPYLEAMGIDMRVNKGADKFKPAYVRAAEPGATTTNNTVTVNVAGNATAETASRIAKEVESTVKKSSNKRTNAALRQKVDG